MGSAPRGHRARATAAVDGDEDEYRLGDLAPFAGQWVVAPHLDQHLNRAAAHFHGLRIEGQLRANRHWHQKGHAIDSHGGYSPAGNLAGHGRAGQVHLRYQPAAVDIAKTVGFTGQCGDLQSQVALRDGVFLFEIVHLSRLAARLFLLARCRAWRWRRVRLCGYRGSAQQARGSAVAASIATRQSQGDHGTWPPGLCSSVHRLQQNIGRVHLTVTLLTYSRHAADRYVAPFNPTLGGEEEGMKLKRLMAAMTFVAAGVATA